MSTTVPGLIGKPVVSVVDTAGQLVPKVMEAPRTDSKYLHFSLRCLNKL